LYRKIPDIDKTDSFWKWQEKPNQYSDQIVRWPRNFESFLIIILFKMTTEFFWNSSRILIRILVASLSIQSFKWLLSSWRIRWPRNSCEILQGFDNFKKKMTKEFLWNSSRISSRILVASLSIQQFKWLSNSSKARWPQNFYKILLGFWSEFCSSNQKIRWPWNSYEILKDFDQIYLQELDDHRILVKFFND
jgi:hypothetical protein